MNNLNYKILGMAVATFCMVMTRPDSGVSGLLPLFYLSGCVWIYFTVKIALHIPHTDE